MPEVLTIELLERVFNRAGGYIPKYDYQCDEFTLLWRLGWRELKAGGWFYEI